MPMCEHELTSPESLSGMLTQMSVMLLAVLKLKHQVKHQVLNCLHTAKL